jgi:hypothetical protein
LLADWTSAVRFEIVPNLLNLVELAIEKGPRPFIAGRLPPSTHRPLARARSENPNDLLS